MGPGKAFVAMAWDWDLSQVYNQGGGLDGTYTDRLDSSPTCERSLIIKVKCALAVKMWSRELEFGEYSSFLGLTRDWDLSQV